MPSNWMSLHWGLNSVNSRFIIDMAKVKADVFMNSVLEGKKEFRGVFFCRNCFLLPRIAQVVVYVLKAARLRL